MSMFEMIFGSNPKLEEAIDKLIGNVGRYRRSWIEKGKDGNPVLAVYTRNGGGNRDHYDNTTQPGLQCQCTGCIATYHLPAHPLYLMDADDEFDCTYATFWFKLPEELIKEMDTMNPNWRNEVIDKINMSDEWQKKIDALKNL